MGWPDFLAMASDLQLVPRILGVGALKAAMEQVSEAPHRLQRDGGLVVRSSGHTYAVKSCPSSNHQGVGTNLTGGNRYQVFA